MKFEVGDKVRAFGCDGVVVSDHDTEEIITVLFINKYEETFYQDGRLKYWHSISSLQLIEKAKKKKKIVLREALFKDDFHFYVDFFREEQLFRKEFFVKWIEGGRTLEVEVDE